MEGKSRVVARLDDGAILRGESRLNIREELPRREVLFGRGKKRPTVGFIFPLLKGMMTELGRRGRKAGEAP